MGPSPMLGSPAQEFYTRGAPRTPCSEDQCGLLSGELEDYRKQILLLKFAHRISQSLRPRTGSSTLMEPGQMHLLLLDIPGEGGGNWDSSWGHRCWSWPFWGAHSTMRTLMLCELVLEHSLWLISTEIWYPSLASHLELPQDKQLAVWGPSSNNRWDDSSSRIPAAL